MKKIAVHFWILLLVCAAAARAQGKDPAYRIGPRDLLSVHVDEDAKLNGDRRVAESGAINLPLLGDVPVVGKTTTEIMQTVKKLLEDRVHAAGVGRRAGASSSARGRSRSSAPSSSRATSASPAAGRCSRRSPPPAAWRRTTATSSTSCAGRTTASPTR